MKKMKKMMAVLLAAAMILGMNLGVFATEPASKATTGSISIANPMTGMEYQVYQMFSLDGYDGAAYSYKVLPEWKNFVTNDTIGCSMLELYNGEYVRIKNKNDDNENMPYEAIALEDSDKANLAAAAIAYAENKANQIGAVGTLPNKTSGTSKYVIDNLELGYYVMSSNAGAICSLTTANPSALIYEKNEQPTVDKKVLEDVNNNGVVDESIDEWRSINDEEAGDTVFYKTTITAKKGAHGYILHDRMGDGLTLNKESIEVKVGTSVLSGYLVLSEADKLSEEQYETYDYYVLYGVESSENTTEVCDFEIHFTKKYLASFKNIEEDVEIVVTYNALLNEHALIFEEGNINATKLQYGDNNFTEIIRTTTYAYMFDVIKTDDQNKVIQNAVFELYRAAAENAVGAQKVILEDETEVYTEETPVKLISKGNETYMVTDDTDNRGVTTFKAGDITIKGLDVGTYYLVEKAAPAGYNRLNYAIKIEFERDGETLKSQNNIGDTKEGYYLAEKGGGVHVVNNTGTLLPETGGTGRTILYTAGSIFTVAAIVVIVTKKRMKYEK